MIGAHAEGISVFALCRPAPPGLRGRGGAKGGGPCGGAEGISDSASQDRLRRLRARFRARRAAPSAREVTRVVLVGLHSFRCRIFRASFCGSLFF